jgi:hypothetical protein
VGDTKLIFVIHWRVATDSLARFRTGAGLSLLFLAATLLGCGQTQTTPPAPTAAPAQQGLEAVLRSDNEALIVETLLQIMDMPGHSSTSIEDLMTGIRGTQSGRESIANAIRVLNQALTAAPPHSEVRFTTDGTAVEAEEIIGQARILTALAALASEGPESGRFLTEFRKYAAGEPSVFRDIGESGAAAVAAFLNERSPEGRFALIAATRGALRQHLLLAAVRFRARFPAGRLRPLADQIENQLALRSQVGESASINRATDELTTLGLVLRLLDVEETTSSMTATQALARARAALLLGEPAPAFEALRQAAALPLAETEIAVWIDAAGRLFEHDPGRQPGLDGLVTRLIPRTEVEPHLQALAALGGSAYAAEAERVARAATGARETDVEGALTYLENAGRQSSIIAAFCDSPWGRDTTHRLMAPSAFDRAARGLSAREAEAVVTRLVAGEPARAGSVCIWPIISRQAFRGHAGPLDAVLSALRDRPAFAELAASLGRSRHDLLRPSLILESQACRDIRRILNRPPELSRIEAERMAGFFVACSWPPSNGLPGSSEGAAPNMLWALLRTSAAPRVLSSLSVMAVWTGEPVGDHLSGLDPDEIFGLMLDGRSNRGPLDYSALILPLLSGADEFQSIGRDQFQNFSVHRMASAARLILLAGDDPALSSWVIARLDNYSGSSPEAFAATFSTLHRAWRNATDTDVQRLKAEELFGTGTSESGATRGNLRTIRERIAREASYAVQQLCAGMHAADSAASGQRCIGRGTAAARMLANDLHAAGLTSDAASIDAAINRDATNPLPFWALALAAHLLVWTLLLLLYPISPTIQASVFWNPWVRKYLGLGYVQLLLLVVPPFTRRLLAPFKGGFTRDGQLDGFRPEIYYDDIRGRSARPEGPEQGRLAALIPAVDGKIWLDARSGSGKSWFLRNLALRIRRPLIFLNATSCAGGVTAAIKARMQGWLAESDFLEQLIYTGRIVIIVDGLNEVAAATRSDIVAYVDRFPRARILIATQAVQTAPPAGARRVEVQPLGRAQIEGFLLGRADEVLAPDEDRGPFAHRVAGFLDSLERGTPKEREELLAFVSNPMDLRLAAALLARDIEPDLLNLQKQQIELVERDYLAANGNPFPIIAFAEALYALRCADRSLMLGEKEWPAEREALRAQRLVLRTDGADGTTLWRFRHDKIVDYFLYVAFRSNEARQAEHLADNRFIGVYVLIARDLPEDLAMKLLQDMSWAGGEKDDFTLTRAFQEALIQKLALQRAAARRGAGKAGKAAGRRSAAAPPARDSPSTG